MRNHQTREFVDAETGLIMPTVCERLIDPGPPIPVGTFT